MIVSLGRPVALGHALVVGMIATAALALLALVAVQGIATVTAFADPRTSLAWMPWGSAARSRLAESWLQSGASPGAVAQAADNARMALRRQPLDAAALRTLGLTAILRGDRSGGARLLDLAERMSRRDLQTQLWLLNAAAARGDIRGALRHIDIALRTSTSARALLFPTLCAGLMQPTLVAPIGAMLARAPEWTRAFGNACVDTTAALPGFASALAKAPSAVAALSDEAARRLVLGLTDRRDYPAAMAMARAIRATRAIELAPLDWGVADSAGLWAESDGGQIAYRLADGASGPLAWRLLPIATVGAFRLSAAGGDGTLVWQVGCDGGAATRLPISGGEVQLPLWCRAARLTLLAQSGERREGSVGAVSFAPISSAPAAIAPLANAAPR